MTKNKLTPLLETLLVLALFAAVYLPAISKTEFHIDEAHWIGTSNMFEAYLKGEFTSSIWNETHTTLTNPPVPRYFIGISRLIGGFHLPDLNKLWDFEKSVSFNKRVGAMPSDQLIWWSRLPMAILAIFTSMIGYLFAKKLGGGWAGAFWVFFCAANPYLLTMLDRAMAESSILFFTFLACGSYYLALRAYPDNKRATIMLLAATGISIGLAAGSKLNGFGSLAGVVGILFLVIWKEKTTIASKFSTFALLSIFVTLVAVLTFWGTYPYLWPNPVGRTVKMFNNRISEMTYQTGQHSPDYIDSPQKRVVLLPTRIFQDYSTIRFQGSLAVNLLFTVLGIAVLIKKARNWWLLGEENLLAIVILALGFAASLPTIFTMLDWDRYYLFPVVFSSLFISVAFGWVFTLIQNTLLKKFPSTR